MRDLGPLLVDRIAHEVTFWRNASSNDVPAALALLLVSLL